MPNRNHHSYVDKILTRYEEIGGSIYSPAMMGYVCRDDGKATFTHGKRGHDVHVDQICWMADVALILNRLLRWERALVDAFHPCGAPIKSSKGIQVISDRLRARNERMVARAVYRYRRGKSTADETLDQLHRVYDRLYGRFRKAGL